MKFLFFVLCVSFAGFSLHFSLSKSNFPPASGLESCLTTSDSPKLWYYENHYECVKSTDCPRGCVDECLRHAISSYYNLKLDKEARLKKKNITSNERRCQEKWMRYDLVEKLGKALYRWETEEQECGKCSLSSGESKICKYPALRFFLHSSIPYRQFDWDFHTWRSPGIWGCFTDHLYEEYLAVNKMTKDNGNLKNRYAPGRNIKLYAVIRNPVAFGLLNWNGVPYIQRGSVIRTSSFFSASKEERDALESFGWQDSTKGLSQFPLLLEITPLDKESRAASLVDYVSQTTPFKFGKPTGRITSHGYDILYPPNVEFQVESISDTGFWNIGPIPIPSHLDAYKQGIYRVLSVKEVPTNEIHPEVQYTADPHEELLDECYEEE